ncbi:MAG TPA: YciI family protein [Candidatus Lustribacter sp.]|jgi:hypothetical protein|nr:YciI family protein [Candidatus Lustribacter sp.]
MKFVTIFKFDPERAAPPDEKAYAEMGRLIAEMRDAGVLVDTGGVMPNGTSARVRRSGSHIAVTDGPFTESKEIVGGFAVLDVPSKDDAVAWTRRFLECAGDGVSELIEVTPTP